MLVLSVKWHRMHLIEVNTITWSLWCLFIVWIIIGMGPGLCRLCSSSIWEGMELQPWLLGHSASWCSFDSWPPVDTSAEESEGCLYEHTQRKKNPKAKKLLNIFSELLFYVWSCVSSFTECGGNLLPLWRPLQDASEVEADADLADIVQKHLHNAPHQMGQPWHRHIIAELKEKFLFIQIKCQFSIEVVSQRSTRVKNINVEL